MLKKLIKYDLKWLNKVLIIHYIIFIIIAIIARLFEFIKSGTIGIIISEILLGAFISCIVNIVINTILRLWVRFNLNLYKDESYLTHTLPISKDKLFNSKVLSGIISIIISIIVIILGVVIINLDSDIIHFLKEFLEKLNSAFGSSTIFVIISFIFIILLELIYLMNVGIFGLVLGHTSNNGKTIKSIIIGLVTYGFTSSVMLGILYLISRVNPVIMELYIDEIPSVNAIKAAIFLSLLLYLIFNIIIYIISKNIFKKGVNVE